MTDAERVAWVTDYVFEHEDDGNTRRYESTGIPDDPIIRGVIALIDRFGAWYDPVLSPDVAVDISRLVLDAANGGNGPVD